MTTSSSTLYTTPARPLPRNFFRDLDPTAFSMTRHRLVQLHEPSGRMNLYIAAHAHHIEGVPRRESDELLKTLMEHATQDKYTMSVPWKDSGDLVIWDNTAVMHRAGPFAGGYPRDMRRTTVHDNSSQAWGLNEHEAPTQGFVVDAAPSSLSMLTLTVVV